MSKPVLEIWQSTMLALSSSIAIVNDSDGIRNNLRTVCDNENSLSGEFETRSSHNYHFGFITGLHKHFNMGLIRFPKTDHSCQTG